MTPEAHESRKIRPTLSEICHDGGARPNILETPNLEKLNPQDKIPNDPVLKKLNDMLRTQES